MAEDFNQIVPLDELDDFDVAEGDPDVRGWDVVASDGRKIGEVDDLLVDTTAMKVRYLDVDADDELIGDDDDDRHFLIPIGYARLDRDNDHVVVDGLQASEVASLPPYTHTPITRDYESSVRSRFEPGFNAADATDDYYRGTSYDDARFYGTSRGTTGTGAEPRDAATPERPGRATDDPLSTERQRGPGRTDPENPLA
jgi:photosynthetic reaction center H subunit